MWALPANRKILLDIFGRQPLPHLKGILDPKPSHLLESSEELLLFWASEPVPSAAGVLRGELLPNAIMVRQHQMREFIAWITTVAGGYRPFTAFVRIIDPDCAQHVLEPKPPGLGNFENAVAGLIIAEALTLSGVQRSVRGLSLLPCESTYSYSFARALALGYVRDGEDPIAAPFGLARKLTRQSPRRLGDELLSTTLKVLAGLAADNAVPDRCLRVPPFIWETCRRVAVRERSERGVGGCSPMPECSPVNSLSELRGPREQRVEAFERILQRPESSWTR